VAVVGRPNVGKSTLVNRLVGEKVSIVSPVPQTTRNRIAGIANRPGAQIILLDTPGIHKPLHLLNRRMVETALGTLAGVDLVYLLVEARGLGPGDRFVIRSMEPEGPPVFLLVNKVDRARKPDLLPLLEGATRLFPFREIVPLSALTGDYVERLAEITRPLLPEGPALFPEDQPTDQPERFLVAEIIREKICLHTRQEVPHETAVVIDMWSEDDDGMLRIEASVVAERANQRGILIGKAGALMKRIGSEARAEIETLLACRVFLNLWVKVSPGWRESPTFLKRLELP
jgi:GTP-binding protein Era